MSVAAIIACATLADIRVVFASPPDPYVAQAPRPSPLPLFYDMGPRFHQKLIDWPSGGLRLIFIDVLIPDPGQPLVINRMSRSSLNREGVFGPGWVSNLDIHLEKDQYGKLSIVEADGTITTYEADGENRYRPTLSLPAHVLDRTEDGGFVREWPDGSRDVFDATGRLRTLEQDETAITFAYRDDSSRLPFRVSDGKERRLELSFEGPRLVKTADPLGRTVRYRYEDGRLREVVDPINRKTLLEYEGDKLIKLTLPRGQAISFRYNEDGSLRQISGPGAMQTSLIWQRDQASQQADQPPQELELLLRFGNGSVEALEVAPTPVDPKSWGLEEPDVLPWQRRFGLQLKRVDGTGVASTALFLQDRVLSKDVFGNLTVPWADALGSLEVTDLGLHSAQHVPLQVSLLQELWQGHVTPAAVLADDPRVRADAVGRPIEVIVSEDKRERWKWDEADRLIAWTDAFGQTTKLAYDPHDHVLSVTGPDGSSVSYAYNDMDLLAEIRDPSGSTTTIAYDAAANPIEVKDLSGRTATMKYDRANRLTESTITSQGTTQIQYNDKGLPDQIVSPSGVRAFLYDDKGRLIGQTDETGLATYSHYDEDGRLLAVLYPDGRADEYTYAPEGVAIQTESLDGVQVTETYDNEGRLRMVSLPGGIELSADYDARGLPMAIRDSRGTSGSFVFDSEGRLIEEKTSTGQTRTYTYDGTGRLIRIQEDETITEFGEFKKGRQLVVIRQGDQKTELELDDQGRVFVELDAAGNATTYQYAPNGQLSTVALPTGGIISYSYDELGRISTKTLTIDGTTSTVRYAYDAQGRPTQITHEDGTTQQWTYDEAGRIKEEVDRLGNTVQYRYNASGQIEAINGPNGAQTFAYDALGRLIEEHHPITGTLRYEYGDKPGEMTVIDPAGLRTRLLLDAFGQPLITTDPLGGKIIREYDPHGRLIGYVDSNGQRFSWRYDPRGFLLERRAPSGATASYRYEGDHLTGVSLPNRQTLRFAYTPDGQWQTVGYGDAVQWTYTYDRLRRPEAIIGPMGRFTYRYDGLDRLVFARDPWNKEVSWMYDGAGRITQLKSPEGELIRYRYSPRGLVEAVETSFGKTEFAYDDKARLLRITSPNGMSAAYEYEVGTRLKSVSYRTADGQTIYQEAYTYDPRGNLLELVNTEGTAHFRDDELGRLVEASFPDGRKEQFTYDPAGNLMRSHDAASWQYNQDQELVRWGERTVAYDGAGNLAKIQDGPQFRYNPDGQLIDTRLSGGQSVTYTYDPEGKRLEKQGSSGTTRYVYAGSNLLAEYDDQGTQRTLYVPGLGENSWLAVRHAGKVYYPIRSYLGTLLALVDEEGRIAQRFWYDSYGKVLKTEGTLAIVPHFAGRPFDPETGLYDFRARYYSPELKRFLSPDPLGHDRDGNRYTYALSNPITFTDSTGTMSRKAGGLGGPSGPLIPPPAPLRPPWMRQPGPIFTDLDVITELTELAMSGDPQAQRVASQTLSTLINEQAKLDVAGVSAREMGAYAAGEMPWVGGERTGQTARLYGKTIEANVYGMFGPGASEELVRADVLRHAAGTATHELTHVRQFTEIPLGGGERVYNRLHEVEAFMNQSRIDPTIRGSLPRGLTEAQAMDRISQNVYRDYVEDRIAAGKMPKLGATEAYYGPKYAEAGGEILKVDETGKILTGDLNQMAVREGTAKPVSGEVDRLRALREPAKAKTREETRAAIDRLRSLREGAKAPALGAGERGAKPVTDAVSRLRPGPSQPPTGPVLETAGRAPVPRSTFGEVTRLGSARGPQAASGLLRGAAPATRSSFSSGSVGRALSSVASRSRAAASTGLGLARSAAGRLSSFASSFGRSALGFAARWAGPVGLALTAYDFHNFYKWWLEFWEELGRKYRKAGGITGALLALAFEIQHGDAIEGELGEEMEELQEAFSGGGDLPTVHMPSWMLEDETTRRQIEQLVKEHEEVRRLLGEELARRRAELAAQAAQVLPPKPAQPPTAPPAPEPAGPISSQQPTAATRQVTGGMQQPIGGPGRPMGTIKPARLSPEEWAQLAKQLRAQASLLTPAQEQALNRRIRPPPGQVIF